MKYAVRTDKGKVRSQNEDSFLILPEKNRFLFAVADGMGGANAGEVASAMAVKTLSSAMSPIRTNRIRQAIDAANRRIYEAAKDDPQRQGMGTTLSLLMADRDMLTLAQVGDSRIYRFRDGQLRQLTEDHSYVMELVRSGAITPQMAKHHPYRNIITRALGTDRLVDADLLAEKAQEHDRYLLCSDGLTTMVEDDEIAQLLAQNPEPEAAADALLKATLDAGATDNVTLIVVNFEEVEA